MGRVLCPLGLDVGGQGSSTPGLAPLTVDACGTRAGTGASGRPSWQRTSKRGTDGRGASRVWLAEASHVRGARAGLCPLRTRIPSEAGAVPSLALDAGGTAPRGPACCLLLPSSPQAPENATMGAVCETRSAGLAGVGMGGPASPDPAAPKSGSQSRKHSHGSWGCSLLTEQASSWSQQDHR